MTLTSSATYRSGFAPRNTTTITSGQGVLEFHVQPHLFTPDDFVGDEVDVAVFARCEVGSSKVSVIPVALGLMLARQIGDRNTECHAGVWKKQSSGCYEVRGKALDGWAGEQWLDIRQWDALRPILAEIGRAHV